MNKILRPLSVLALFLCSGLPLTATPWIRGAGGGGNEGGGAVTTDASGNIFLTGTFTSTSLTFGNTVLLNAGGIDFFLVKFGPGGNVLWAVSGGGSGDEYSYALDCDGNGNVYVTGSYTSSQLAFGNSTLTNAGMSDVFLVKYTSSGSVDWAKTYGSAMYEEAYGLDYSPAGFLVLTGYFSGASLSFGNNTITNAQASANDIFLVRLNQNGNVQWAKSAGGSGNDAAYDVAGDQQGNIFITGGFASSTISFGSSILTQAGSGDIFVARYNSQGNPQWAKQAGGIYAEEGYAVHSDNNGNIVVCGYYYSGALSFGAYSITNSLPGLTDFFLVKYDLAGTCLWAYSTGGTGYEAAYDVTQNAAGQIFLCGAYTSPSLPAGNDTLACSGQADIFTAGFSASGIPLWVTGIGSNGIEEGTGITADPSGSPFICGYFSSPVLDSGSTAMTNESPGTNDIFLIRLGQTGNPVWAAAFHGAGYDWASAVAAGSNGNTYITGGFSSQQICLETGNLVSKGGNDIFLARSDSAGSLVWALSAGGTFNDAAYDVVTDPWGNVIICGAFLSNPVVFGQDSLLSNGGADAFAAKFDPASNLLWVRTVGGSGNEEFYGISCDQTGSLYLTGYFDSPTLSAGGNLLINNNPGTSDIMTLVYDGNGNILWAGSAGGTAYEAAYDIVPAPAGGFLLCGASTGAFPFGTGQVNNAGNSDLFLLKYLPDGSPGWAFSAGGSGYEEAYSLTADSSGICIGGYFTSNDLILEDTMLTNASPGLPDMMLLRFGADGSLIRAAACGGTGSEAIYHLDVAADHHILVTGGFSSPLLIMGSDTLEHQGNGDVFLAAADQDISFVWAAAAGGSGSEEGLGITASGENKITACGYFGSPSLSFGDSSAVNTGYYDLFWLGAETETTPVLFNLQGQVVYDNDPMTPLAGAVATLLLAGNLVATDTSDSNGQCSFPSLAPGTYQLQVQRQGDWGGVNATDALLILKHFVGLEMLAGIRLQAADTNGDNFVNAIDALAAVQRFSGIIGGFITGDWVFETLLLDVTAGDGAFLVRGLCTGDVNGSHIP
ncbi:MAG TPA: dockerin type I domain-containing protein [Bacteroidales bacterium]|nr:dockerin type I domain-containing protein [Bacteroidales bacterium]HSA43131.1 dockerin type I domain-containing protein [Bacteroidales bacterium]